VTTHRLYVNHRVAQAAVTELTGVTSDELRRWENTFWAGYALPVEMSDVMIELLQEQGFQVAFDFQKRPDIDHPLMLICD
jgi:hypothetical protein